VGEEAYGRHGDLRRDRRRCWQLPAADNRAFARVVRGRGRDAAGEPAARAPGPRRRARGGRARRRAGAAVPPPQPSGRLPRRHLFEREVSRPPVRYCAKPVAAAYALPYELAEPLTSNRVKGDGRSPLRRAWVASSSRMV